MHGILNTISNPNPYQVAFSANASTAQHAPSLMQLPTPQSFTDTLYQSDMVGLYQVRLPNGYPWPFLTGVKYPGMVQGVPLIRFPDGREVVKLLITWRPPMGPDKPGNYALELPGGGWDPKHTANEALQEEIQQELGYSKVGISWPLGNPFAFAVSPGMTGQQIALGLVEIDGREVAKPQWEEGEAFILKSSLDVPVSNFLDPVLFNEWLSKMQRQYILPENILAIPTILRAKTWD